MLLKRPELPDIVTASGPTVAVRVPAHPITRALLNEAGVPIAALGRPDLDLTEADSIARAIDCIAPVAVVNAAAYTAVDRA